MAEKLTEMISVVFTKSQMAVIEKKAALEDRKVSSTVRYAVLKHLGIAGSDDNDDNDEAIMDDINDDLEDCK
jgi:hypothetical protein